ncbi:MAG: NAD(P)H-dependent oxidoreductase subunit E, partial [Thermodesulfovibrionales bacterium]|nr:NAD(P)H-dependent oxidoreductase subunit E [Thermodesulfovibrionales bacterium]
MKRLDKIESFFALREEVKKRYLDKNKQQIRVCCGTGCRASGAVKLLNALKSEKEKIDKKDDVEIVATGCQGLCEKGPVMNIAPQNFFYQKVDASFAQKIIEQTVLSGMPVRELLYRDAFIAEPVDSMDKIPFYKKQHRLVLKNNERIDPLNIYHYIAYDGYLAFQKALFMMTQDEVVDAIKKSGLRGRGGAGFPTGLKWDIVKRTRAKVKIVVANGDEGEPGAFMDRSI